MFVDLDAEMLAAEQGDKRIAVEFKGFDGRSELTDLEQAGIPKDHIVLAGLPESQRKQGEYAVK